MSFRFIILIIFPLFISGCAKVPSSSVTLSNSIAEDVVSMQTAHKEFVNNYYNSLEQQANSLIDNKYRPSLIRQIIEKDVENFKVQDRKHLSLFNAIQEAFINNENMSPTDLVLAQSNAMLGMDIFYSKIDKKVEKERNILLSPLRLQRKKLLGNLNTNYSNIIKKNAAISALLNSVIKVHETEQQLFAMVGVKSNVREEIGIKLSDLAQTIEKIQSEVKSKTEQAEKIENAINEFKELINKS